MRHYDQCLESYEQSLIMANNIVLYINGQLCEFTSSIILSLCCCSRSVILVCVLWSCISIASNSSSDSDKNEKLKCSYRTNIVPRSFFSNLNFLINQNQWFVLIRGANKIKIRKKKLLGFVFARWLEHKTPLKTDLASLPYLNLSSK